MQSVNFMHLYKLPETRRDEPEKLPARISVSTCEGAYSHAYVSIAVEGGPALVLLGEQIDKGTKNAMHTVRGCLDVENRLDTFDVAPTTYEHAQKVTKSAGPPIFIRSASVNAFVAVSLPSTDEPCVVKGDELLAAVENATRR